MNTQSWKESTVANLIRRRIGESGSPRLLEQIATEAGLESARMLLRFASGEARVPLDLAVPLAVALNADPGTFLLDVLRTYMPLPSGIVIAYRPEEDESNLVDLNFKVAPNFHRRFKSEAANRGTSMKQLLEDIFYERLSKRSED